LLPVKFVPYNDADAIRKAINQNTAGVFLEPIQGEGGVIVPSDEYLKHVREICDEAGILLILDEVQTGFGRTGRWFAKQHSGVAPDIMTVAKAMGGGFPMGAMLASEEVAMHFQRGDHASTFGGNPLSCAAALANIQVIKKEKLVERARELGDYMMGKLKKLSNVEEVRGKGLMIGVEFSTNCGDIADKCREQGVLLNCTSERVLRLVPPLIITKQQIDTVIKVLNEV